MQKKTIPRNQKGLSFPVKGTIVKNVGKRTLESTWKRQRDVPRGTLYMMDSASKKHSVLSNEMIDEKRLAMRNFYNHLYRQTYQKLKTKT